MTTPPPAKATRATVGKINLMDAVRLALGSTSVLGACFLLHTYMVG